MDQRENNKAVPEIEAVKIPLLGVKLNPLFFVLVCFLGFFWVFFSPVAESLLASKQLRGGLSLGFFFAPTKIKLPHLPCAQRRGCGGSGSQARVRTNAFQ